MEHVLEQIPEHGRVLIIRLRSLGDCVLTTPALALFKQARPDLDIAIAVEDRFAPLFEGNPDLSAILPPTVAAVVRFRPRLTLNLHGGTRSMALVTASASRYRAGFAHFRAATIYNVRIPTAQQILGVDRTVHTAEHLASAVFHLGVPRTEIPRARLFAHPHETGRPYAVLHPLASAPDKTWPAERFLATAARLRDLGLEPVFIGATSDDMAPFAAHHVLQGAPLAQIKSLMAGASLFVGNDSGPAHMAAAFGVPVAVVFGNSDAAIWSPWKTESVVLSSPDGIAAVTVNQMAVAIEHLQVKA